MTRDLDELMNEDPLNLSEQDIDDIIAYNRKARGEFDDGKKVAKPSGPKVDLVGLGLKPKLTPIRRF